METSLPSIPAKRYFTIGEVSSLCGVKPYVLRYWEQEFAQLKPMKRRGNRRYYQHHEVLLIRRIRELLYEQGFTISGARNQLSDASTAHAAAKALAAPGGLDAAVAASEPAPPLGAAQHFTPAPILGLPDVPPGLSFEDAAWLRRELLALRALVTLDD